MVEPDIASHPSDRDLSLILAGRLDTYRNATRRSKVGGLAIATLRLTGTTALYGRLCNVPFSNT